MPFIPGVYANDRPPAPLDATARGQTGSHSKFKFFMLLFSTVLLPLSCLDWTHGKTLGRGWVVPVNFKSR